LLSKLVLCFHRREDYYAAVIANQTIPALKDLITIFKNELNGLELAPTVLHNFSLSFSLFILGNPLFLKTNTAKMEIQAWINESIRAFRSSLEYDELDLSSKDLFLQTLRKYSSIKALLLNSSFADQVPEDVLLGTEQCEWPEILASKLESAMDEVGVSELEGRRVSEKLNNAKTMIEFAADEELELSMALLEKLLISVRSGIEWMKAEKDSLPDGGRLLVS
jgi:hypothetical protein